MSNQATSPPSAEVVATPSSIPYTTTPIITQDIAAKNIETPIQEDPQPTDLKRTADTAQLETEQPPTKRQKKRRIIYSPPTDKQSLILLENAQAEDLIDLVESIENHAKELVQLSNNQHPLMTVKILENNQVRIGPDRATIKKIKKEYSDEYNSRPETIRKKELNRNNPEVQEKRKAYAARPEVREKKRLKAKEGRLFKRMAKTLTPNVHDDLMARVRNELVQKDERSSSSSDSSEESSSHDD